MAYFTWTADMSVGLVRLDDDHKVLISIINRIADNLENGSDHREMAQVAHSATRYVPNVLAYETPSTTHFEPTVYMDTADTLALKISALEAHESQVERTHLRLNIVEIALATSHFRGVQGKMSCAEAFMPIRIRL